MNIAERTQPATILIQQQFIYSIFTASKLLIIKLFAHDISQLKFKNKPLDFDVISSVLFFFCLYIFQHCSVLNNQILAACHHLYHVWNGLVK